MTRVNKARTKRFMITKIDPDLWRKFKTACAHYDLSSRDLFINLMENIVYDHEKRPADDSPPMLKGRKELKKK
ncbi:hypothetical protein ES703_122256 [subsurface metagenome]